MRTIFQHLTISLFISILLLVCLYLFSSANKIAGKSDLVSLSTGASIIKAGLGKQLYDLNIQLQYQDNMADWDNWLLPFRALPWVGLFFIPFTYMPFLSAYQLFLLVNSVLILLFVFLAYKSLEHFGSFGLIGIMATLSWATIQTMIFGQISLIVAILAVCIYLAIKQKKHFWAGVLSAFLLIKIQYLLLVPYIFFLLPNKRHFLKGFFITSLIILFINFVVSGDQLLFAYPHFLSATELPSYGSRYWETFTLYGTLTFLSNQLLQPGYLLMINAALYLASLIIYRQKVGKRSNLSILFAVSLIMTIIFSVHSLAHDLTLLLFAVLLLVDYAIKTKKMSKTLFISIVFLYLASYAIWLGSVVGMAPILILIALYLLHIRPL